MTTLCRSKGEGQEEECEFARECLFLAQFRDTGPAIRIFAHAAMFTPRNQLLPTPHLIVIDELFWRNAAVHARLPLDRLPEAGRWRFRPRKGEPRKKTEDRMLEAEDAAIRAWNALLDGRDPRTVVSTEKSRRSRRSSGAAAPGRASRQGRSCKSRCCGGRSGNKTNAPRQDASGICSRENTSTPGA